MEDRNERQLHLDLSRLVGGFYGSLTSLVSSISQQYSLALERSLGAALSYLIVDTVESSKLVSSLLKDKGLSKTLMIL